MSIIFILAALGLTFGYTNPKYSAAHIAGDLNRKSVKELQAEKLKYEAALVKTAEIEEARQGLLTKYNTVTKEDRERLLKIVPDTIDSVRLIIDVNNIAAGYGMSLSDISLTEQQTVSTRKDGAAAGSNLTTLPSRSSSYVVFSFSVQGSYGNLISFLSSMEKSLRILDITDVSIDSVEKTGTEGNVKLKVSKGEPTYSMKVTTRAYYLKQK